MITDAMRAEVQRKERELAEAKRKLATTIANCDHKWGDTQPAHIYQEAYTIPGDPPGTMGVDWRGPCYVPASTDYRWSRTCSKCGHTEYTTQTTEHKTYTPKFN